MMLKGSQRGGARQLALHLLNTIDNDHVEVHSIDGFVSDDVTGALQEIFAISRATNCKQFMFSLSLSPPNDAVVTIEGYETTINEAAERIGLAGQPKVVMFHEKEGRRHCHVVFSRIDAKAMKGINLPFFKDRLNELSHEVFLMHGWDVPAGFKNREHSCKLNYDHVSYGEAKRAKRNPQAVKSLLLECWQQSDDCRCFEAALAEKGFMLCRGDRGFLVVDMAGKPYSLSRWLKEKPKVLRARLGDPEHLPHVDEAVEHIQRDASDPDNNNKAPNANLVFDEACQAYQHKRAVLEREKEKLVARQRQEREQLEQNLIAHRHEKALARQKSLRTGLSGLWDKFIGTRTKQLDAIRVELEADKTVDNLEKLKLSSRHLSETRTLQTKIDRLGACYEVEQQVDHAVTATRIFAVSRSPLQVKALANKVRHNPVDVLHVLTDKESVFTKEDIAKVLHQFMPDTDSFRAAMATVLSSDELVALETTGTSYKTRRSGEPDKSDKLDKPDISSYYTTRTLIDLETDLMNNAKEMAASSGFNVSSSIIERAIAGENHKLQSEIGVPLSEEQKAAIRHVTSDKQLSCVVGVAGAGKSTMLSAAKEAWEHAGFRVFGAALAGKAAQGLEQASGIKSRTISSYQLSWRNGLHHLQKDDVLVVDEAGMIGSKQMATLITETKERGARLVLVGDPDQLQPINAGTPFKSILEEIGSSRLDTVHRQKEEWQRKASEDFAQGRIPEALHAYDERGAIQMLDNIDEALDALVYDYMEDWISHGETSGRLALAHRRDDVKAMNNSIRDIRKAMSELQDEHTFITPDGSRQFATGDRLLFTRNDRDLGVKNGMLGTVTVISKRNITVELDDKVEDGNSQSVTFSIQDYNDIDHGYATTIHRSQGATVDKTFILASNSMNRNLTYVAGTRHKHDMKLYARKDEFRNAQKLYAALDREEQKDSLHDFNSDSRHNRNTHNSEQNRHAEPEIF